MSGHAYQQILMIYYTLFMDKIPINPILEIITIIALIQSIGQILRFSFQIHHILHIYIL